MCQYNPHKFMKVVGSKFGVVDKANYDSKLMPITGVAVESKCWG